MEVFVAFSDLNDVPLLEDTMLAWEQAGAEPVAIQVKKLASFELFRRITADNMAEGLTYLLADLGCVIANPSDMDKLFLPEGVGLMGLRGTSGSLIPTGVRLCRRRAVKKWDPKITDNYDVEHARSMKNSGMRVEVFRDISYKHLLAH